MRLSGRPLLFLSSTVNGHWRTVINICLMCLIAATQTIRRGFMQRLRATLHLSTTVCKPSWAGGQYYSDSLIGETEINMAAKPELKDSASASEGEKMMIMCQKAPEKALMFGEAQDCSGFWTMSQKVAVCLLLSEMKSHDASVHTNFGFLRTGIT